MDRRFWGGPALIGAELVADFARRDLVDFAVRFVRTEAEFDGFLASWTYGESDPNLLHAMEA